MRLKKFFNIFDIFNQCFEMLTIVKTFLFGLTLFEFSEASELVPKLYQLDPYDDCLSTKVKFSSPVYCIADVFIKPNKSNSAWMIIEENSNSWKTQYRHDHLVHGVCIGRCKKLMEKFDKMTQQKYFHQSPKNFSTFKSDPFTFVSAIEDEIEFGQLVNECINYELSKRYQLESFSRIQYCEVSGRVHKIGKLVRILF